MEAKYNLFATTYLNDNRWITPSILEECCVMKNKDVRQSTLEKIEGYSKTTLEGVTREGTSKEEIKKWTDITRTIHLLATCNDTPQRGVSMGPALKSHMEMLEKLPIAHIKERDRFLWNHLIAANQCLQMMVVKSAFLDSFDDLIANSVQIEPARCLLKTDIAKAKQTAESATREALLNRIITINTHIQNKDNSFPTLTDKLLDWAQRLRSCNTSSSLDVFEKAIPPILSIKKWCEDKLKEKREKMMESFHNPALSPIDDKFRYYVSLQSQIAGLEACIEGIRQAGLSR